MTNLNRRNMILRLKGMEITRFWFKNHDKALHLAVKPYKNSCRCENLTLMGMKILGMRRRIPRNILTLPRN